MLAVRALLCLSLALLLVSPAVLWGEPLPVSSERTDRHGDPLPEGAIARLGTIRLRPGRGSYWNEDSLALSPDGKLLATGEPDLLRFWETATGKEVRSVELPEAHGVLAVLFSPDGKRFAAHAVGCCTWYANHALHVGEVASGKVLQRFDKELHFRMVGFSPDGNLLAAIGINQHKKTTKPILMLWNVRTGQELRQVEGVGSAAFTQDGKSLVLGNEDGGIGIEDLATGREIQRLEGGQGSVHLLAVSPDGHTLVSAGEAEGSHSTPGQKRGSVHLCAGLGRRWASYGRCKRSNRSARSRPVNCWRSCPEASPRPG
jgi:WD40 repeat protein